MELEQVYPAPQPAAPPAPAGERTPWGFLDMAMAIGIVIGGVIVLSIPIVLIVSVLAVGEIDEDDDTGRGLALGIGFILEALLLAVAAFFSVRKYGLPWASLGLRRPARGGYWSPVPLFFAVLVTFFVYTAVVAAAGGQTEGNVPEETFDSTVLVVLLGILSLALAPLMEETFFRGFLFGGLRGRWGVLGAAFGSGLLFALAHFQGFSDMTALPVIGMIGVLFAFGYYYTGSLYAPIVTHLTFNLLSFVLGVLGVSS